MNFIFRLTFCQEFHRFFVMRLSFHKSAPCLNESQKAGDNESNKTLLKKKKKIESFGFSFSDLDRDRGLGRTRASGRRKAFTLIVATLHRYRDAP